MATITIDFGNRTAVSIVRQHGAVDWEFTCPMTVPFTGFLTANDYDFIDDWAAALDVVGHLLGDPLARLALRDANMLAEVDRWYRFHTATPAAG